MNILGYLTPKSQTFYLDANSTIRQALEKFDYHKFSVVPLVDRAGEFVATVSEGDILRYIKNHADFDISAAQSVLVKDIEKYRPYEPLNSGADARTVLKLLAEQNFVPVVDDRNMFIGIIKRKTVIEDIYKSSKIFFDGK